MAHDQNNIATWPLQEQAKRLWEVEGGHCVLFLVSTLAGADYEHGPDDLGSLMDAAVELCSPIEDWDAAATEEGWEADGRGFWFHPDTDEGKDEDLRAEDVVDEPHYMEIYEHWIVSDWLADQLAAKGEKVDKDFAGLTIWARTTTGQAVYADHVIEQIAAETYGREG
ncbi:hypothetical protein [Devosia sp. FJ2-5-3]|uniref:hypothetical protein n=1 Tax=Devosia sp. FJ2-5-3 TaxID=2976680 RepID=UPI0023D81812|nr:hypothetical protein [Devosia sp. FJ2-5-3]WEJ60220.1 hypothetical protein N0P34_09360 [Devosia sp. FJ2-5-3]